MGITKLSAYYDIWEGVMNIISGKIMGFEEVGWGRGGEGEVEVGEKGEEK